MRMIDRDSTVPGDLIDPPQCIPAADIDIENPINISHQRLKTCNDDQKKYPWELTACLIFIFHNAMYLHERFFPKRHWDILYIICIVYLMRFFPQPMRCFAVTQFKITGLLVMTIMMIKIPNACLSLYKTAVLDLRLKLSFLQISFFSIWDFRSLEKTKKFNYLMIL